MKIKSEYLDDELDFNVIEKLDPLSGKTMLLITHDSLRDVIYNQLSITKRGGSVNYSYITSGLDHAVVQCTIDDGNGRIVTEIGEATADTLDNQIAKSYPVLIASQRAFDRAVILLLMLAGKNLSSGELGEYVSTDFESAIFKEEVIAPTEYIPADPPEDIMAPDIEEAIVENILSAEVPGEVPEDGVWVPQMAPVAVEEVPAEEVVEEVADATIAEVIEEPATEEVPVAEEAPAEDTKASRIEELANTVFGAGKYSGKNDTIAQIYEKDKNFVKKVLAMKNPAESLKERLVLLKEYVDLVG